MIEATLTAADLRSPIRLLRHIDDSGGAAQMFGHSPKPPLVREEKQRQYGNERCKQIRQPFHSSSPIRVCSSSNSGSLDGSLKA